jgi:hypothetical protein
MSADEAAYAKAFKELENDVVDLERSAELLSYLTNEPPEPDCDHLVRHMVNLLDNQIAQLKRRYFDILEGRATQ